MKRVFSIITVLFAFSLCAELMVPIPRNTQEDLVHPTHRVYDNNTRVTWDFATNPVGIIPNYYDYQPGNYNSTPVRVQPDVLGGGVYIVFHARETAASIRRVYYCYIDDEGYLTNCATISTDDIHEGYAGIDLDPITGDPIVVWHANMQTGSADLEIVCSYDLFHLGSPGLWKSPFVIINDNTISPNAPSDEFIWPYSYIGPSPNPGKRRVYVTANNSDDSPTGSPSENQLIAYADFDVNDLNMLSEFNWSYVTIPLMDDWHMGVPEWKRPNCAMAVSDDGKVAIFGYVITDADVSNTPDRMFCFVNDNYGMGDFVYYEGQAEFDISNPQNQDGSYRFIDPDTGQPQQIYMEPYLSNHMNAIFTDDGTKLKFPGNMNMMIHPASWFPDLPMMYPKVFTFDLISGEFSFIDIDLPGTNPNDNIPMIPWDLNEDGVVDQFDPDGYVTWVEGWPIYHYDNSLAFHENTMKITKNEDNDWLCAVWSDGLKARLGNIPEPGYEDWAEYPEIALAISADNGQTWSETILMNAKTDDVNYVPELDGMIPCYIYPGDEIEDIGNGFGRLHLFFLDDNSYGSSIQGHGENLGGTMIYTSIDIDFSEYQNDINANFSATPTFGVAPLSVQFNDISTYISNPITTWEWDFENDGIIDSYEQNPSYTYLYQGVYTVKLTVGNGIETNTEIKPSYINVDNPVSSDFEATPLSGFEPLDVQFTDISSGNITNWEWDFEDDGIIDSYEQNPVYTYPAPGDFTVTLTVSDGTYQDTEIKDDYIEVSGPLADFVADITSGYVSLEVQFTDQSIGNITSWEWDFDNDGTIDSNEQNPSYTYSETGEFTVSLTVSNVNYSNIETKIEYIEVLNPIAFFEADQTFGYIPLDIQFNDLSLGNIDTWEWDFDSDGIIDSNEQNPIYTYTNADTFSVALTVYTADYSDTQTIDEFIVTLDHVDCDFIATPLNGIIPLEVQFTCNSIGSISQWEWDFNNDGMIDSTEPNPTCTYSNPGNYSVRLLVTDGTEEDYELKLDYISASLTDAGNILPPLETTLQNNFPNPFNPMTYISFEVKENEVAQLTIFNVKGQLLLNERFHTGRYHFPWNASEYSSGVYSCKLKSASYEKTQKMIFMK